MNAHAHDHDHDHDHDHEHEHEPFDYVAAVLDQRAAKDRYFALSPNSPIPSVRARLHDHGGHDHGGHDHGGHDNAGPEAHGHDAHEEAAAPEFVGLSYFEPDERYQFEIERPLPYEGTEPVEFEMTTSDGRIRTAFRAATLPFEFDGEALRLHAYRFAGSPEGSLFVPFQDATSGSETYGAARYLDLEIEEDGGVVLDFNLAYHPYCAYNEAYSCPLPPAENRLPVRIEAGERLPE